MIELIKSMLEDNSGGISTIRVCLLLWVTILGFNMTYGTITEKSFPITGELVALTSCLFGAKAIQRFGEKGDEEVENTLQNLTSGDVRISQLPLTVSVQGSVPVSGMVPISANPSVSTVIPLTPVVTTPQPSEPEPLGPGQVAAP